MVVRKNILILISLAEKQRRFCATPAEILFQIIGIGPKEKRKRVFEYAWPTEESNQFGTADFIEPCRKTGAEPLICVNMGSGTAEEAMHWVPNDWLTEGVEKDSTYTLHNALVTALILNMFIRNSGTIEMANYSTFININGALSVKKNGVLKRSQYSVFELIRKNTGEILYRAEVAGDNFTVNMPEKRKSWKVYRRSRFFMKIFMRRIQKTILIWWKFRIQRFRQLRTTDV